MLRWTVAFGVLTFLPFGIGKSHACDYETGSERTQTMCLGGWQAYRAIFFDCGAQGDILHTYFSGSRHMYMKMCLYIMCVAYGRWFPFIYTCVYIYIYISSALALVKRVPTYKCPGERCQFFTWTDPCLQLPQCMEPIIVFIWKDPCLQVPRSKGSNFCSRIPADKFLCVKCQNFYLSRPLPARSQA